MRTRCKVSLYRSEITTSKIDNSKCSSGAVTWQKIWPSRLLQKKRLMVTLGFTFQYGSWLLCNSEDVSNEEIVYKMSHLQTSLCSYSGREYRREQIPRCFMHQNPIYTPLLRLHPLFFFQMNVSKPQLQGWVHPAKAHKIDEP